MGINELFLIPFATINLSKSPSAKIDKSHLSNFSCQDMKQVEKNDVLTLNFFYIQIET